jgi:hypothetical protein
MYWKGFRGFGFDKLSWYLEAHYAGFTFGVLKDFFVVHLHHPYGRGRFHRQHNYQEMKRFKLHLNQTYGVRCEDLNALPVHPPGDWSQMYPYSSSDKNDTHAATATRRRRKKDSKNKCQRDLDNIPRNA